MCHIITLSCLCTLCHAYTVKLYFQYERPTEFGRVVRIYIDCTDEIVIGTTRTDGEYW